MYHAAVLLQKNIRGSIGRTYVKRLRQERFIEAKMKKIRTNLKWMRVKRLWEKRKLNWFVIKIKYGYARHKEIEDPLYH